MTDYQWFGRTPPASALCAWGARAVFQDRHGETQVDLVWNRGQPLGSAESCAAMAEVLDNYLLPELRYRAPRELDPATRDVLRIEAHGWVLEACPNASHGHLYIGCWPAGATLPPPVPPGKWEPPPASHRRPRTRQRAVNYGR